MPKSTTPEAAQEAETEPQTALAPVAKKGQLANLVSALAEIPTVEEDPTESMVEAILQAGSPAEWEEVFTAASFKDSASRKVRVHAFRASPSQFGGRLPVFLVLDVTYLDSGERGVMTCGSEMAVAQLLNAYKTRSFPLDVEIYRKPTPTREGFFPMRLRYLGDRTRAPLGDPSQVVSEQ